MAHELETINGRTAFVTARIPAWHQLGTVMPSTMTTAQALQAALLGDWDVRLLPIEGIDGDARIEAADRRMSVRTNPVTGATDYLGIVGADYHVIQNEECAELLDAIVDESGAHIETAGSLRGGRATFITMRMPEAMTVAGSDRLDLYLVVTTSHDGTAAARVDATPVRVVCANTQRAALRQSVAHFEFRHTTNAGGKIAQARQALGLSWKYFDAFQTEAESLIDKQLTMDAFSDITSRLWPLGDDATKPAKDRAAKRDASLRYLFRDAGTQDGFHGTAWGGYQAITEYIDHYAPASRPEIRARRAVTGAGPLLKERAFDMLAAA